MPTLENEAIRDLFRAGSVIALSIDTCVFERHNFRFSSGILGTLSRLKSRKLGFILSSTVFREMRKHMSDDAERAKRELKAALGKTCGLWDFSSPTREDLLAICTKATSPNHISDKRLKNFIESSGCEILEDPSQVSSSDIMDSFFERTPPFSEGKKSEFPDAFALNSLNKFANDNQAYVLVVSTDGDWRRFCEKSKYLILVEQLDHALGLVTEAPAVARELLEAELMAGTDFHSDVRSQLEHLVHDLYFDVEAWAPTELEAYVGGQDLDFFELDHEQSIEIVSSEQVDPECFEIVASVPLMLNVDASVELEFSVFDSIDRDTVSLGGRAQEVEVEFPVKSTVTFMLYDKDSDERELELYSVEISPTRPVVRLGDISVYEPEDA